MLPYWILFAIPSIAAALPRRSSRSGSGFAWLAVGLFFTTLIGLRFQVGGDWGSYIRHYRQTYGRSFWDALGTNDPGYAALNWLSGQIDGDVQFVNLVSGAILMTGVVAFARRQPLDWLALVIAVPYLITVVAMGYTRQSIALGFELLALNAIAEKRNFRFVVMILLGALFHKTAVVLLPLAALSSARGRIWTAAWVGITTVVALQLLLRESSDHLWTTYVEQQMQSQGALIRVIMNVIPAVLFLVFRSRFQLAGTEKNLWTWISIIALICLVLVGQASTAVDRIALYLLPIQMYVLSRFPLIFPDPQMRIMALAGILAYSAAILFVWLNFAVHAQYWVPYRFAPFAGS
jgi:hypothetical protein